VSDLANPTGQSRVIDDPPASGVLVEFIALVIEGAVTGLQLH
jgi:hypothetical protein